MVAVLASYPQQLTLNAVVSKKDNSALLHQSNCFCIIAHVKPGPFVGLIRVMIALTIIV